ncbi:uncharacterized protein LOC117623166 isoform X2 [Prunus dulcis]|uniref:uncharacterized protein LOC117623166 isoform X2 n=1 Tax=Prunus dulcis TaxID=3755 RepID=UPI001482B4A5|nr:uncharacterized protein LOC117623166 isoform X2 [Prunus dulcis]
MAAAATDDDGWVNLAMNDEAAVVDVLLLLRHAEPPRPSKTSRDLPSLRWSVRQRRSKNVPRHHHASDLVVVEGKDKKKGESSEARASPTTPLSWSGATSVSGGALDGSEESSRAPKPTDAARSKVAVRSEAAIFKRPRKKKTLAELKEEESFLLKERRNLKNQLATLRLTVEKQRATNESLRKIKTITHCLKTSRSLSFQQWPTPGSLVSSTKDASCIQLDLQLPLTTMKATTSVVPGESISYQLEQVNAVGVPTKIMPTIVHCSNLGASQSSCPPNVSCKVEEAGSQDAAFSLPDLNLPFGDDPSSEVLYRTS